VSISNQNNADIFYQFTGNNITRVDNDSGYNFNSNGKYANLFEKTNQSSGACPDIIQYVPSAGNSMGNGLLWTLQTNSTGSVAPIPKSVNLHTGACFISGDYSDVSDSKSLGQKIIDYENFPANWFWGLILGTSGPQSLPLHIGGTPPANPGISGGAPASTGSTTGSGPSVDTPSCESSGGPISWITCAVFEGVSQLESKIENKVLSFLQVTPINFSTTCNQGDKKGCIFNVWASFRVYGNLFLIIALLIAVLVEAIGGGMVANYTIKKMIPRILVAVILINLSIYFVAIMIDIFNVIGVGVYDLIKQPFQNAGVWHITVGTGTGVLSLGLGGAAAAVLVIVAAGDGIGFLLLAIGVPALLAVIGVLITIVVRQGLIVFLTITAPIAFALYCLPNTEQYFKKWWDLLIKTLVVYPVVALIIAIAGVTSVIFGTLSNDDSWNQVLGIIAGIIPLFLIPFAFKISGGVISQVSGMTKKGADWANKSLRGNPNDPNSRYNTARSRAQAGREQNGTSVGAIGTRLRHGRGGAAIRRSARTGAAGAQELASNPINEQWKGNSDYNDAGIIMSAMATGAMSRQQGEFELNRLATANNGAAAGAVAAARQIRQSAGTGDAFLAQKVAAGYGYNTGNGEDPGIAHDRLVEDVARSTGSRTVTNNGRVELDPSEDNINFRTASQKLVAAKSALGAAGFGHLGDTELDYNPNKGIDRQDRAAYAANKGSAYIAQGRGAVDSGDFERIATTMTELDGIINSATASPEQRRSAQVALDDINTRVVGANGGVNAFTNWSTTPGNPKYAAAVARARLPGV
jgi:hypothetical protein